MSLAPNSLAALLEMWRRTRDPALADCIDLVFGAAPVDPIVGSVAERLAIWAELIADADPQVVGRALVAFPIGTIADAERQLEALAQLEDPRVSGRLVALLEDPPLRSPAALGCWTRAFEIVESLRDVRVLARLRQHAKRVEGEFAPPMGRLVRREITTALARMEPELGGLEASAENLALLATLRKKHAGNAQGAELLAAVRESPHSDEARLVYADYLMDAGDPRGEFIGLSLAHERGELGKEQKRRLTELTKQYALTWLDELAPVLNKTGLEYRRGFVDTCVFKANNAAQVEKLIGHPAWATVRVLSMDSQWPFQAEVDRMILHPVFRSLRELGGFTSPELMLALTLSEQPRPLRALSFNQLSMRYSGSWSIHSGWNEMGSDGPGINADHRRALSECPGLPELRHLTLGYISRIPAPHMSWLFEGALGQRLERLSTQMDEAFIPSYLELLRERPLAELEFLGGLRKTTYMFTRGASGGLDQVDVRFKATNRESFDATPMPGAFEMFLDMLEALPPAGLAKLAIKWPKKKAPTPVQLERLARAVAARPELEATYPGS